MVRPCAVEMCAEWTGRPDPDERNVGGSCVEQLRPYWTPRDPRPLDLRDRRGGYRG